MFWGDIMIIGAVSDIGLKRGNNQDCMFASREEDLPLFIVADGMGGHHAGDVASSMAVSGIINYFKEKQKLLNSEEHIKETIKGSVTNINDIIYLKSLESPEYNGMGTTVTLAYIYNSNIYIGHVGDSRAYIIRDNKITQLTEDHSVVNELIKCGTITPSEALTHPQRNMITRAVGTSCRIKMDFSIFKYRANDILILCSDGLTNMISEDLILNEIINSEDNQIEKSLNILVEKAKENGGRDNITVIGIKFDNEVLI